MNPRAWVFSLGSLLPESLISHMRGDSKIASVFRPIVNVVAPSGYRVVDAAAGPAKGIKLYIDPKREKYYWTGLHERHVQHQLELDLEQGDTVWDIGAHIGFMSLLAARLVGSSGMIHAFEPMSLNRERLRRSIDANFVTNISIHPEAVTSFSGEARLFASDASLMWSLAQSSENGNGETVSCITIDDLASKLGHPDLIKIDAEGAEVQVLQGGLQTLSLGNARIIIEFTNSAMVDEARQLLPFLDFKNIGENHWLLTPNSHVKAKAS